MTFARPLLALLLCSALTTPGFSQPARSTTVMAPPMPPPPGKTATAATAGGAATGGAAASGAAQPASPGLDALGTEIPQSFTPLRAGYDFERTEVMIPMRDGVRLKTVILTPRPGAPGYAAKMPILLTRTPYNAARKASAASPRLTGVLPTADDVVAVSGYIRVFQDVRGKYGSEGGYVMNRPIRGPLNPTQTDHSTDTFDTIDWLVKTTPANNGRVGIIGTSYDGFTAAAALIDPHPALKASVPVAPMVDGWRGDDWFHNGAFRQGMLSYIYAQQATRANTESFVTGVYDEYDWFLRAGSADDAAQLMGLDQVGFWRNLKAHPAYDDWWRQQAVDRWLAARPLKVATLWVHGLWDQEDIYGAPAAYAAVEPKDRRNDMNFLVMGPWNHGGGNRDGSSLGAIRFADDTGAWFRRQVLQPFLDQHLKPGAPKADLPPVLAYRTGADRWERLPAWPAAKATPQSLYLQPGFRLAFAPAGGSGADAYVSDPAKPVPYRIRPNLDRSAAASTWRQWLVDDQRPFSDRTDVLTYVSEPLTAPLSIAGAPEVRLTAATTGTDADWVVKLIDVYPDEVPAQPALGGYQLPVSMDIFRGRYRESLSTPKPIPAGAPQSYRWALPNANHTFQPGHRIMIQVQSSWFPLYDRNPQTFVPNIMTAPRDSYRKAEHRILWGGPSGSAVVLPVVR